MPNLTPFNTNNNIFNYFDELENNFMKGFGGRFSNIITDIVDKGDKYVLEAEIPGFNKEDISIEVDSNRLTISVKHDVSIEDNKDNYIRKERRYGAFTRSFDVSNIKIDGITADFKNGVLKLELPKKEENDSTARRIDII